MVGTAVGDALGYAREGLSRRVALKMFGRPPLRYRLVPGIGLVSDDTQLMLLAAQAMLNSRSEGRFFRRAFQWRLSWYLLSLPVGIGRATLLASAKSWLYRFGLPSGVHSLGNGAAPRAMFCALAIHGTGHRRRRWVEDATALTHTHPLTSDGCQVLAALAEYAATTRLDKFDAAQALAVATEASQRPAIGELLAQLAPFLEQRRSPAAVARFFGWDTAIPGSMVPTTIMATYCWLRFPNDFYKAVGSAVALGGDSDSLGAIVGGLVGAHVGFDQLPKPLIDSLMRWPHGPEWMEAMADRLSHWPHGVNDLSSAPAQPSDPLMQVACNLLTIPVIGLHVAYRLPYRMLTRSKPRRARRRKPRGR